ncbi:PIN domain-containing protein [Methylosinus sp. RM1]|uniref:PIN domain-containing protein n=1 Tax=Methylosinus sp. RM1 TaxID=2583817 RepID=UPI001409A8B0|nr:PIN domain-containing protein [Methylosinus sp. RM1]
MLDANIITDMLRYPRGRVVQHVMNVGEFSLSVSAIVAAKLRQRAAISGASREAELVEGVLSRIVVMPFGFEAEQHLDRIRDELQSAGKFLEQSDLFLAAHAFSLGLQLVTDRPNVFGGIRGLKLENWLA